MQKASDIMQTETIAIRGSSTVAAAVKLMKKQGVKLLIVDRRTEADAYGIVTESDIAYKVIAYGLDPKTVRVYEIMTKPCISVNPNLGIEYVARLFAQARLHHAPVIGEKLLGVISLSDIVTQSNFVERPKAVILSEEIEKAILSAREACELYGAAAPECAAAWDIVEELQAEAAHQKSEKLAKTAFEQYVEEHPEAAEAREYDV